jgi:hypothetical protein
MKSSSRCISPRTLGSLSIALLLAPLVTMGCASKEEAPGATAADETGRPLSDMELPVSLRTGDPAPTSAYAIEATTEQLRIDGAPLLPLEKGRVAKSEADFVNGVIPKLAAQLKGGKSALSMRLQANLPYETTALILGTAAKAGIFNVHFQVRKTGATPTTGWLNATQYVMSSRADDVPPITAAPTQSWDAFTAKWDQVLDGCKSGKTGNCAYVDDNFAVGGTLKIELFASGRGVNVDFFRRGLTEEQKEDEAKQRMQHLSRKKEDFLQGRITHDEMVEILLLGDPSTYALFQHRYQEALTAPSALTATMAPMCHSTKCGVVVAAETITSMVNVLSLIGAAFPDGTPAPAYAFEQPWTKKPKVAIPAWANQKDPALEMAVELGLAPK